MSATMTKGRAPNYSDSVLKHAIVGIIKTYPHISPESLSGELHGAASFDRLAKLIKQSAKWTGSKWICTTELPDAANPLPRLVSSVKADLIGGMTPMAVAAKRGVEYSMVLGVNRGRYDGLLKTPRNSKKFVKVNNLLKLYDTKGYIPSGKSIKGALEVSDDCNQIKCHECGDWFENLAAHIRYEHEMKTRDYKMAHGLNLGSALIGDAQRIRRIHACVKRGNSHLVAARAKRSAMIAAGTGGTNLGKMPSGLTHFGMANLRGNCAVQLTTDLRILADRLGHIPSVSETKAAGICHDAIQYRFGGVKKALATVGVNLSAKRSGPTSWYNSDQLIGMLKAFYAKHKRQPFRSDLRRGLLPSSCTFVNHFGSLNKALVAAGMHPNTRGWTGVRKAKRAIFLAAKTNGAPVPAYKVSRTKEEAL
jgi:hypothetical protein